MQRWKGEFTVSSQKKCIQINRNGDFEHGRILYMEPDWDCLDLLNAASQRLDMVPAARRIFNVDGNEIDDCMMVEDHDILFFSIHEDFITISNNNDDNRGDNEGKNRPGEGIPPVIGGYKVGELLGRGGFGEVRIGEHQLTAERVALKFLRKSEIHSLRAAERTNVEIQCLATLKHSNIIKMHQHLECQYHFVLVFELMEGGDLLSYLLNRKGYKEGSSGEAGAADGTSIPVVAGAMPVHPMVQHKRHRLSEDEARHTFYQVLCAISYAHNQHICHRDLKLENILLKDSNLSVVKIADFGLSDFYRPGATMKSSCGTLSFLAPEVFQDTANAGPPLDVWSLGVILFAVLNGRLPFEGPDLKGSKRPRENVIRSRIMKCQYKMDENLSVESKDLMRRLLQVDPAERASIPEIFNHMWMRTYGTQSSYLSESYFAATTAFAVQTTPHHGNGISLFPSLASSSTPTVKHLLPPLASMTGSDMKRTEDDTTAVEQEEDLSSPVVKLGCVGKSGSFPSNSQAPTDGTSDGGAAIDSIPPVGVSSSPPPFIDGSQKALSSKALSVILENDESNNASNSFKLAPLRRGYTQHNLTDDTSGAGAGAGVDSPIKVAHNGVAAMVRPSTTIGYVKRNTDGEDDAVRTSHWRNIRIEVLDSYDSPKTTKSRKHSASGGNHQPLFTTTTKTSHRRDSVQNTRHGHTSNTYSNHNRSSHHAASPRTPAAAADHDSSTLLPPTASQSQSSAPPSSSTSTTKHHHGGAHAVSSTANTQSAASPHLFPKPPMSASSGGSSSSSNLQHSHHHYSAIFSGKSHGAGAGNK